jgi:hypothetical protein
VLNVIKEQKLHTDLGLIDKGDWINSFKQQFQSIFLSRELLWQYFLPTLYEDSPITQEPSIGQTRIFKSVRFKLSLNCATILDLYFMNKMVGFLIILYF